jgi:hypothetical protein
MNLLNDPERDRGLISMFLTGRVCVARSGEMAAAIDDARADVVELVYDPADPWTISIFFPEPHWQLSREDLRDCVLGSVARGVGDVRITSQRQGFTRIDLSSPTGKASLWLDTTLVDQFLFASYSLVPEGSEMATVNWGYELSMLGVA